MLVWLAPAAVKLTLLPSLTDETEGVNELMTGPREVSFIVTVELVANRSVLDTFEYILARNVSLPSVVASLVNVTLNDPVLLLIVVEPALEEKSADAELDIKSRFQ